MVSSVSGSVATGSAGAGVTAGGARTREIVRAGALTDASAVGGRFSEDDVKPSLAWILVYVLQEYARHAGHLDVARELADGEVGE